ncbi:plasmid fertility inhibition factor family protein [Desulfobotulus mexicanus]|uniref:Uncharacterized protein n=1 Tax=Desulfobotulus mexicanus TaxID=2586642 RepID=A0A5S5MC16_9BACT|nr:hypothetical protein [Desulfobotulus mexicanus]TYT73165.1 hypothetical protein FIM25_16575 [Desulfobotulus mexicanus]
MKIQATRKQYIPTWVNADILEELWKVNHSFYVESWVGEPRIGWFAYDIPDVRTGFHTADMYLKEIDGKLTVGFINGRHRTRWLLSKSLNFLPVGLEDSHFEKACEIGLAVARVLGHEEIEL